MSSLQPITCPVCGAESQKVMDLTGDIIRAQVSGLFGAPVPDEVQIADYAMRECQSCALVFADPMQSGDGAYYGWITAQAKYHAGKRWEWGVLRADFAGAGRALKVLEVGCGDGKLMEFLSDLDNVTMVGVDVSAPSVEKACKAGFDVRLAAFEDIDSVLSNGEAFDAVILSHVLEHVGDPLGVMRQARGRLAAGGSLYAAVPYSPMSRELAGWDIQNLPPHHLTRWNQASLTTLGNILELRTDLRLPKAKSPLKRAVQETCGEVLGDKHPSVARRVLTVLTNLSVFAMWLGRFRSREQVNGRAAGDSVLARFFRE